MSDLVWPPSECAHRDCPRAHAGDDEHVELQRFSVATYVPYDSPLDCVGAMELLDSKVREFGYRPERLGRHVQVLKKLDGYTVVGLANACERHCPPWQTWRRVSTAYVAALAQFFPGAA